MIRFRLIMYVTLAATLGSGNVFAQTSGSSSTPLTPIPEVPAQSSGSVETQSPDMGSCGSDGATAGGQNLSDKLSECSGVLTPPSTNDTGIQAPAPDPDPGTTPVVPPQSSPADPHVVPK